MTNSKLGEGIFGLRSKEYVDLFTISLQKKGLTTPHFSEISFKNLTFLTSLGKFLTKILF
jgi:hypothetical protein